jgi:hypothetical protein
MQNPRNSSDSRSNKEKSGNSNYTNGHDWVQNIPKVLSTPNLDWHQWREKLQLDDTSGLLLDKDGIQLYQELVGSLLYVNGGTRPDTIVPGQSN